MVIRGERADAGPVVVAVDGSPKGERAVEFAFAEAALRKAEILAVHAWLPDYAPAGTGVESAERLLAQALAGHAEKYPRLQPGEGKLPRERGRESRFAGRVDRRTPTAQVKPPRVW
ncbi:universal stress protein [Streptomyces chartreusis]|uniref:universal stress protein n=1 Tax=Streptomyces chartreusis TaxID=1969 RepID=UPI00371A801D